MIVRGESTIIEYHAPFDQGLKERDEHVARFPIFHAFDSSSSPHSEQWPRHSIFFSLLLGKTVHWISLDKDKMLGAWDKEKIL